MIDKVICEICGKSLKWINHSHLKKHNITLDEYKTMFPNSSTTTQDYINRLKRSHIGHTASQETRLKMSDAHKGNNHPMYGKKHSPMSKQKMSDARKGKTPWNKGLKGIKGGTKKGTKFSKSHCENISKSHKGLCSGSNHPMYGKHHTEETKKKISLNNASLPGPGSPSWKGGISFEPYCPKFNDKLKEKVRNEYNRKCVICGKNEIDNGRKLDVHHIDYHKNAGCDGREFKLIPLCWSCHDKTHHNRDYWETYCINILEQRGSLNQSNENANQID